MYENSSEQEATVPIFKIFTPKDAAIRSLNPLDIVRCALLDEQGRSNRAFTLSIIPGARPFSVSLVQAARESLSPNPHGCALVVAQGNRILGFASAKERSGNQAWEIPHLFITPEGEDHIPRLLDELAQIAVSQKSQRIFLRLHREDPLVDVVRQSGFFPRIPEILYGRQQAQPVSESNDSISVAGLREKHDVDDHNLFRLYNMTTPPEVRYAVGMTMEQWASSLEHPAGRHKEYVLDVKDSIKGWLRVSKRFRVGLLEAVTHFDHEDTLPEMVDFGLQQMGSVKAVYCLVPEYQLGLQRVLEDRQFQAISDYVTLVKTMTVRAEARSFGRATVPSM